jgi:hypothetical protein
MLGPLAWSGFRRVEMIRDALLWSLCGIAFDRRTPRTVLAWLKQQGFDSLPKQVPKSFKRKLFQPSHLIYPAVSDEFARQFGTLLQILARGSQEPADGLDNFLRERGGAHWSEPHSFLISSAFVRLLATLEDFEKMVLKVLLHYFPAGKPTKLRRKPINVDPEIIFEEPKPDLISQRPIYSKPLIWTWLRKPLQRPEERQQAFVAVFGIKMPPPGTNQNQYREWREIRNAISHGYTARRISLPEYVAVEVYVASVVRYLAIRCAQDFNLKL